MTWVDGVILALLAVSALLAFFRGLVREVLGVGAWVGALVAGFLALPWSGPVAETQVSPDWLAEAVAVAVVFLVVLVLLKLLTAWIAHHVQRSALGGLDRALGVVFGLVRGAFLVLLAYIVVGPFLPPDRWPSAVREARALPLVAEGARWLVEQVPEGFRPPFAEPPIRPDPSMDELLRPPARNRT